MFSKIANKNGISKSLLFFLNQYREQYRQCGKREKHTADRTYCEREPEHFPASVAEEWKQPENSGKYGQAYGNYLVIEGSRKVSPSGRQAVVFVYYVYAGVYGYA